MGAYNKLFAAVIAGLLTRWLMQWAGLDVNTLGVSDDLREAVSLALDAIAVGVPSAAVWLVKNVRRDIEEMRARYLALLAEHRSLLRVTAATTPQKKDAT